MSTIIGLVVVIGAVLGGFAMSGGPFPVLLQPNELLVIGGAALGTLIISSPGKIMKRVTGAFKNYCLKLFLRVKPTTGRNCGIELLPQSLW